jgi:glycosyltransferase involved in cell wall biosynthesis
MLTLNLSGQGTYWRAFHLGRQLARRGHAVTLLSTSRKRRIGLTIRQAEGMTLIESPDLFSGAWRSGWDGWNIINRLRVLHNKSFDLVHAFESRPTVIFPALHIAGRQKIPLVMDWCDWFGRGGSVEERPNPLLRALLRPVETFFEEHFRPQARGATVICSVLREKALHLGIPTESILLLPNGSDTEGLLVFPLAAARQEMSLSDEDFIVGYLGAIFHKDAQLLTKAFDILCEHLPNARLLMVGNNPDDLRRMVKQAQRLTQTGYVDQRRMNLGLAACDVLWLPLSDTNANRGRFPLKVTDYLAVGRPIVATAVGDLAMAFAQLPFGLLTAPNPSDFAAQTLRLHADPALREKMGFQARRLAETHYDWRIFADQLESFYRRMVH